MKVCSVFALFAFCVFFYSHTAQANGLKCYYCLNTCADPMQEQTCPQSSAIDYRCISAKATANGETKEVKGCVSSSDQATKDYCDQLDKADGGSCFMCDSDLCNSAGVYTASVVLLSSLLFALTKIV